MLMDGLLRKIIKEEMQEIRILAGYGMRYLQLP